MRDIPHFIDGAAVAGTGRFGEVFDPNTGAVQARVALGGAAELDLAVQSALKAQALWAQVNPQRRARVMFAYARLLTANLKPLAELLSSEHGKVVADSMGDIQRGLEVVEFACGVPHALKGDYTEGAGPGIDVYSMRQPLGVTAGITPFNFPAMIPLWMGAVSLAVGNAFILKPSEKDPSVPVRLAELFMEAGAEAGVEVRGLFNVLQGDRAAVEAILDHPDIKAVSFVGSSDIAAQVYARAAANGKRVQAMGGAKNHGVVMPDADMDQAVKDILGAAYGSAGERCMALPVVVPVGKKTADALRERLVAGIAGLKVGTSGDPAAQYGPVVTRAHRDKIADYIEIGVEEGAELVVDGRDFRLQGYEEGFFLGPSLFDRVKPGMKTYEEEIFGPVLQIVRAESFEEAVALPSRHAYGNGVAIFTADGAAARAFVQRVEVGMVGINVPIPVPVAYHSFGGWKRSGFGDSNQYGMEGVRFWTRVKTVTARWPDGGEAGSSFVIPTMK
jgi:malonate-semialdehyde dehydrogenase (acetylating)/methylmalonate-semialdehyde dehydrogenase